MFRNLIRILQSAFLWRSSGHSQLRGTTKQTQNLLEGLSISSVLGKHLRTLQELLECCLGERLLEYPAAFSTRAQISRRRWIDGLVI